MSANPSQAPLHVNPSASRGLTAKNDRTSDRAAARCDAGESGGARPAYSRQNGNAPVSRLLRSRASPRGGADEYVPSSGVLDAPEPLSLVEIPPPPCQTCPCP